MLWDNPFDSYFSQHHTIAVLAFKFVIEIFQTDNYNLTLE